MPSIDLRQALWDPMVKWITGSPGTTTSFIFNVISLVLAVWGFYHYFVQKREYRVLFEMMTQFGLQEKIKEAKSAAEQEHSKLQGVLNTTRNSLATAQQDLRERLPIEARRAYFENAIPMVAKQIFDLSEQLERMKAASQECGYSPAGRSPEIDAILSDEIRKHMTIRRDMEKAESLLTIYTGAAAAVGFLIPYPFNILVIPLAVGIVQQCWILLSLWRIYYGRKRAATSTTNQVTSNSRP